MTANRNLDAVIVGAGHNGLVCGAYLARTGYKVLVVERRPVIGGACVTESPWPGYLVSSASYLMSLLQPKIMLDLDLRKHGLEVVGSSPTTCLLDGQRALTFWPEPDRLHAEIAKISARDADAYKDYRACLERMTPFIRDIIWQTPLDLTSREFSKMLRSARFAVRYFKYRHLFNDLYDILTMSAYDYLRRWFESDTVIALLGYYVQGGGTHASMKMPATAFSCIRVLVRDNTTAAGGGGFVRGGMGSISAAIARSGAVHGMEVRVDAPVRRVLVEGGRAAGVELKGGEVVRARCVISNANAKTTFLKLLSPDDVPATFRAKVNDIPPYRRDFAMVFQNFALFPHLTVADNVAFGLKMSGVGRAERETAVANALAMVKLSGFADRYPKQLSGGQQQRVAIARAIVMKPAVLLLDEPLGALDKNLREAMQVELRALQRQLGITTVFVTHDQEEALTMSDAIAVMRDGVIEQLGPPREVYEQPATEFVATFLGASNLIDATVSDSAPGTAVVETACGRLKIKGAHQPGARLRLAIRPERVRLVGDAIAEPGVIIATVRDVVYRGMTAHVMLEAVSQPLQVFVQNAAGSAIDWQPGRQVSAVLEADSIVVLGKSPS